MIDFACVFSMTPTWSNDPRWCTPGIAATEAEHGKLAADRASSAPVQGVHRYYPFVVEDRGRLGKSALTVVCIFAVLLDVGNFPGASVPPPYVPKRANTSAFRADVRADAAPQRYGATRELRSVRSGRFGHQPAASEFCRKCGKSTTVDGLPVVREEALVSAVTEAMYDRMNGHGHHMELPTGYSVGPSDPKAWPFLTAFDDPKVYAMRELHALCEAHFMDPMDDSDALRDVMG
eukprot:jgi/Tetstr1/446617/TSEL_034141.t1